MLSPQDHDSLTRLQLLARGVVDGFTGGRHRSPHHGASVEFKEHRQYVRGDEIRSVDWKLYAKSDRLFIRQTEDETNLRAMILLDQSGSMSYRGTRSELSKHAFAVRLAACLATLLVKQQDAVGLATFDSQLQLTVPPRSTTSHLRAIYQTLIQSQCGDETSLSTAIQQAAGQLRRRGILMLISDCFDTVPLLLQSLRPYRHLGSEVIVFQIWDRDELDFPFHTRTQFRSLEDSSQQRIVDPNSMRLAYLERLKQYRSELADGLTRERIDLVSCTTDQPLGELLSAYMHRRQGRKANR